MAVPPPRGGMNYTLYSKITLDLFFLFMTTLNFTVLAVKIFHLYVSLFYLLLPLVAFTESLAIITFTVENLFCLGLHNIFKN